MIENNVVIMSLEDTIKTLRKASGLTYIDDELANNEIKIAMTKLEVLINIMKGENKEDNK